MIWAHTIAYRVSSFLVSLGDHYQIMRAYGPTNDASGSGCVRRFSRRHRTISTQANRSLC